MFHKQTKNYIVEVVKSKTNALQGTERKKFIWRHSDPRVCCVVVPE
jgi:hypothetical protein